MNRLTYNISIALGTVLLGVGAGLQWGLAIGLMMFGALIVALTLYGTLLARRR